MLAMFLFQQDDRTRGGLLQYTVSPEDPTLKPLRRKQDLGIATRQRLHDDSPIEKTRPTNTPLSDNTTTESNPTLKISRCASMSTRGTQRHIILPYRPRQSPERLARFLAPETRAFIAIFMHGDPFASFSRTTVDGQVGEKGECAGEDSERAV